MKAVVPDCSVKTRDIIPTASDGLANLEQLLAAGWHALARVTLWCYQLHRTINEAATKLVIQQHLTTSALCSPPAIAISTLLHIPLTSQPCSRIFFLDAEDA